MPLAVGSILVQKECLQGVLNDIWGLCRIHSGCEYQHLVGVWASTSAWSLTRMGDDAHAMAVLRHENDLHRQQLSPANLRPRAS